MNIIWHGQSCFEIIIPQKNERSIKIVINPLKKNLGLKVSSSLLKKIDILLITEKKYKPDIETEAFLIDGPGEYEIKGIFIKGIYSSNKQKEEKTIYVIKTKDVHICHLGDFNQKELTEKQVEEINQTEIIMIPVGGNPVINAKQALKIINQIEPSIIIPMYYRIPGLNIKLDSLDKFLKEMGEKNIESLDKLSVKKQILTEEKTKIIILKP